MVHHDMAVFLDQLLLLSGCLALALAVAMWVLAPDWTAIAGYALVGVVLVLLYLGVLPQIALWDAVLFKAGGFLVIVTGEVYWFVHHLRKRGDGDVRRVCLDTAQDIRAFVRALRP